MLVIGLVVLSILTLGTLAAVVGMAAESIQGRQMRLIAAVILAVGAGVGIGVLGHTFFSASNPNRVFIVEGHVSGMNADRTSFCVTPEGASSGEQVCAAPIEGANVGSLDMRDAVTAGFAQYQPPEPAVGETVLLFVVPRRDPAVRQ